MKDKAKRFFIEKKELLIFIGVVVLVFAAVITVSSLAMRNNELPVGKVTETTNQEPSATTQNPLPTEEPLKAPTKFSLPVAGEYEIVREYFDKSLDVSKLEKAVIQTGSYMKTSTGIGYAMKDNSTFDVIAIYDGIILDVVNDELKGATVTIKHSNDVISIYSSLADLKVNKGDSIKQGAVIAKASTSIDDIEAGVHVFLEVKINDELVNPTSVFGKNLEEISNSK